MSTYTASELTSEPKGIHAGMVCKSSVVSIGDSGTASSVYKLVKIPNGATVVDYIWSILDGGTNQTYKLGVRMPYSDTSTVTESILSSDISTTGGVVTRGSAKLPVKISFTSNAIQQWAWIEAVNAVQSSSSSDHRFTVFYTMDGS